ncbi:TIGR02391 family protein [Mycolicibacterium tusciae]|uniref:TIGR02391 family protein n=1 Tax=Mycolicibacterium tusciae TaxID=75922 RepID=UPI001EF98B1C|nr:TIGR02391 family protein [Mycolicibacterium tusciae]
MLADTQDGLTGSQIGQLLSRLQMEDPGVGLTKWRRLEEAFVRRQNRDGHPQRIITFIQHAMEPANYVNSPELFTMRQDQLDEVLTFVGLRIDKKGIVRPGARSSTLDEASRNATSLRAELRRRDTHDEVLRYCTVELLKKNNFHASLEATKSVFERVRQMSSVSGDGATLIDAVLAPGKSGVPIIAINDLASQTDRDEQTGFVNLIKGLAGMFRNPVAHDPRALRTVTDTQLLELVTALSMVHHRLDAATINRQSTT